MTFTDSFLLLITIILAFLILEQLITVLVRFLVRILDWVFDLSSSDPSDPLE